MRKKILMLFFAAMGIYAMAQSETDTLANPTALDGAEAMYQMGMDYYRGNGLEVNYEMAITWFQKAAKEGHAQAMTRLGTAYYFGEGTAKNYTTAVQWYRKAAELGDVEAMRHMGVCYEDGYGIGRNLVKAREWYEQAALKGDATAMYFLAELYKSLNDDYQATDWYERAAQAGHAKSMGILCRRLEKGIGCQKNQEKADEWGQKARENGQYFF